MMKIAFLVLGVLVAGNSFAKDTVTSQRKPASVISTIWETREIPIGKACPFQAQRYDDIAYQVNGNGGYVCYTCDYTDASPFLVVTEQSKCSKTISCKNGKCN